MKSLLEYIPADRIIPVETDRREEILRILIAAALPEEPESFHERIYSDITAFSRKKEVNLGNGFFLVHTRTSEIPEICISVGLLSKSVRYRRGETAHTVLCIIVPDSMSRTYLSLMARLSRFLSRPDAEEVFLKRDPQAVRDLISAFEEPRED
ncbi:MAG: hypothetical protein EA427_10740 [Spirochaetaceae bacterium]|nr:MAG: hypothetical protein EA427_10740 [Spirochaetaceae bacterium]